MQGYLESSSRQAHLVSQVGDWFKDLVHDVSMYGQSFSVVRPRRPPVGMTSIRGNFHIGNEYRSARLPVLNMPRHRALQRFWPRVIF